MRDGRFLAPVFPGDTLAATSEVIGLKENSSRKTGVVYVRTRGTNQHGDDRARLCALGDGEEARRGGRRCRRSRAGARRDGRSVDRWAPPVRSIDRRAYDVALAGSPFRWEDYAVGERIDHVDGMTVEEAEHQLATRLYQNTARVHFNQFTEGQGRFGRRLIYGGHVISLARALSFNGLANAFHVAAINAGRHVAPLFAGQTVFAWSEILATAELPGRDDVGALRLRTIATKDRPCHDCPRMAGADYDPAVILDLDYWALMPRAA